MSIKSVATYNEYYHNISSEWYSYENGNWVKQNTDTREYECPGFEQIYP